MLALQGKKAKQTKILGERKKKNKTKVMYMKLQLTLHRIR